MDLVRRPDEGANDDGVAEIGLQQRRLRVAAVAAAEQPGLVFAPPVEFYKAKTALLEAFPGLELEVQEITFLPQATKILNGEDLALFERFLGMLNDCDDVQEIYHNVSLP